MKNKSDYMAALEVALQAKKDELEEARTRFEKLQRQIPSEIEAIQKEIDCLRVRGRDKDLTDLPQLALSLIWKKLESLDKSKEAIYYLGLSSPLIHQSISMSPILGGNVYQTIRLTGEKVVEILTERFYLTKTDLQNLTEVGNEFGIFALSSSLLISSFNEHDDMHLGWFLWVINEVPCNLRCKYLFCKTLRIDFGDDPNNEYKKMLWEDIDTVLTTVGEYLTFIEFHIQDFHIGDQIIRKLNMEKYHFLPRLKTLRIKIKERDASICNANLIYAVVNHRTRSKSFSLIFNSLCYEENIWLTMLLPTLPCRTITNIRFACGDDNIARLVRGLETVGWRIEEMGFYWREVSEYRRILSNFATPKVFEKISKVSILGCNLITILEFCTRFVSLRELKMDTLVGWKIPENFTPMDLKFPFVKKLKFPPISSENRDEGEYLPLDLIQEIFKNLEIIDLHGFTTRTKMAKLPNDRLTQIMQDKVDVVRLFKDSESLKASNAWVLFPKLRVLKVPYREKKWNGHSIVTQTYFKLSNGSIQLVNPPRMELI